MDGSTGCASGRVAALPAMADLGSGVYDTALVVGIELEKTVPGDAGAAGDYQVEDAKTVGTLNFGYSTPPPSASS